MKTRFFTSVFLLILVIDQATKWWAEQALANGERISVLGDYLSFVLVYNPGAAFSLGTGSTYLFTIFSVVVLAGIFWVMRKTTSTPWLVTLGMIAGGAAGNLVDRLARDPGFGVGHVVDFISYNGYFVGNIADIALVVGVLIVIILELRSIRMQDVDDDHDTDDDETDDEEESAQTSTSRAAHSDSPVSPPSAETP